MLTLSMQNVLLYVPRGQSNDIVAKHVACEAALTLN
jgi:hypothetical protein